VSANLNKGGKVQRRAEIERNRLLEGNEETLETYGLVKLQQQEMNGIGKKMKNLFSSFQNGKINSTTYKSQMSALLAEMMNATKEINVLNKLSGV
jgi:hypothetical protein